MQYPETVLYVRIFGSTALMTSGSYTSGNTFQVEVPQW